MKNRIVLWGTDENEKKVLLGVELLAAENKVKILSIEENLATEAFYNEMMSSWRNNKDITFPEGHKVEIRELSVTDDLLPETLRVERTDVINRAKTEWHFAVLSAKMYEMYKSEVDSLKEKVEKLTAYDKDLWEEMKTFWSKVQTQVREKNLYRDHANTLRETSDSVFDLLKKLRKSLDAEFEKISKESLTTFFEKLEVIEGKIEKGLGLKPIFNELKNVQNEFRDAKFTKGDRNKVWNRIDKAFKNVKEKRFGDTGDTQSATSRIQRRYDGLMSAIGKMEKSIGRDKNDKSFEDKRINQSDGQLETQIRQAKVRMIEERINSKQVKLDDMLKTKVDLEKKLVEEKKREAKREEKKKIELAKAEIKQKVQQDIKAKQEELSPEDKAKMEKAAADLSKTKKKKETTETAASTEVAAVAAAAVTATAVAADAKEPESIEKVAETVADVKEELVEAVTPEVVAEVESPVAETIKEEVKEEVKVEEVVVKEKAPVEEAIKEEASEVADAVSLKEESLVDKLESSEDGSSIPVGAGGLLGAIAAVATDAMEDVIDTVKAVSEVVGDKIEDVVDAVKEELPEEVQEMLGKSEEE